MDGLLKVNSAVCNGCSICELTCSFEKFNEFNPRLSCIRILKKEISGEDIPVLCIQCYEPKCVDVCSTHAIFRDKSGLVLIDDEKCDACLACVKVCPLNAIYLDPMGRLLKCDLCKGAAKCVKVCPVKALSVTPRTTSFYEENKKSATTIMSFFRKVLRFPRFKK